MFKDCGWEHITDFNGFSYFRKLHSGIESDAEFEIYNDGREVSYGETDFNEADASYFASLFSSTTGFHKDCQVEVVLSVGKCF